MRLLARDYGGVDSVVARWLGSGVRDLRTDALDLRAMSEREQGRFRASNATFWQLIRESRTAASMRLVVANGLARIGRRAEAADLYERLDRELYPVSPVSPEQPLTGDVARAFSWHHALEADALAATWPGEDPPAVDTVRLRTLADSVAASGMRSYYGRDWHLSHHIVGLIAAAAGRWPDAVREFQAARWGAAGWTATDRALAQAYLALGRSDSAIAVLRDAYKGPLDAMGRYEPRTELDYLMALAFARAGVRDSASVYAGYVRRAWEKADPEVRRRLAVLPQ
jgi:tetratricopeptide (TPR) repeat protein